MDTTDFSPFLSRDFAVDPLEGDKDNTQYIVCGLASCAQWVIHAGPAVHQFCKAAVIRFPGDVRWTWAKWELWKSRFRTVAEFEEGTCDKHVVALVARAYEAIISAETAKPSMDYIKRYKFIIPLPLDDSDEEEDDQDEDDEDDEDGEDEDDEDGEDEDDEDGKDEGDEDGKAEGDEDGKAEGDDDGKAEGDEDGKDEGDDYEEEEAKVEAAVQDTDNSNEHLSEEGTSEERFTIPRSFDWNSIEEIIGHIVEKVVNGDIDCADAAPQIHKIIMDEYSDRLPEYLDPATRRRESSGAIIGPPAVKLQIFTISRLAETACLVSAEDPAQDRMISLIVELQKLPKTVVKAKGGSSTDLVEDTLWETLEHNGTLHYAVNAFAPRYSAEDPAKDVCSAPYINWSAFAARLFGRGLMDNADACPVLWRIPALDDEDREDTLLSLVSTAQWMLYAGPAVYQFCKEQVIRFPGDSRWMWPKWTAWKTGFATVAQSDCGGGYDEKVRSLAARALEAMTRAETEDPPMDFVERYKFMVPLPLEDSVEEEEDEDEEEEETGEGDDRDEQAEASEGIAKLEIA